MALGRDYWPKKSKPDMYKTTLSQALWERCLKQQLT